MSETLAKILYNQGLVDAKIGQAIGKDGNWAWYWRKRNNLPPNGNNGIHYSKVLKPEQAKEMHRFLVALKVCARTANTNEVKPNVGQFMKAWAGKEGKRSDRIKRKYEKRAPKWQHLEQEPTVKC